MSPPFVTVMARPVWQPLGHKYCNSYGYACCYSWMVRRAGHDSVVKKQIGLLCKCYAVPAMSVQVCCGLLDHTGGDA